MRDQATSNKNNPANQNNANNRVASSSDKSVNRQGLQVVPTPNSSTPVAPKETSSESGSLNKFRETLKDILEEITALEVNTLIVSHIPLARFDAREFYADVMQNNEEGLQNIKKALLERSNRLKKKGAAVSQTELDRYNRDLEIYKKAERKFIENKSSQDPEKKHQFAIQNACYEELAQKMLKLNIAKDDNDQVIPDAAMIRYFRKLWEFEQSVLNGELIYAQTKFQLDGDLSNRFLDDLFVPSKSRIDPKMAKLVFDLHNQAVENAEKQWMGLITTCVNLVKELIPFRAK